ncbi:MAG: hypothetical protein AAF216_01160 [Pseudomonadota bacterium]
MTETDPRPTEPRRPLPGEVHAAVPLPEGRFQPREEWAWDQLATTGKVNMSEVPEDRRGGEDADKAPVYSPFLNLMKVLQNFSRRVIGFGFKQSCGVAYFLSLILVFAWLGDLCSSGWNLAGPSRENALDYAEWVRFSLPNSIPIVELDPVKEDFLANRFDGDGVPEGVRWAFWSQRIASLVLLFSLAAGFTGWAQRRGE